MAEGRLHFGGRRLPVILQTEAAECGLACLAMVASYHGHQIELTALRRRHPVSLHGVSLRGLMQVAGQLDFTCRPLRYEIEHLRELALPSVVHWDLNHFVVLKAVGEREIVIHDPAVGERRVGLAEASKHLSGVALELLPAARFQKRDERERLALAAFWNHASGLGRTLAEIFALSLALEVLALAGPFYLQITVDEVITRGDVDLLLVLALGFTLLLLIRVAVSTLRARIILIVQNALHYQIGARLFRHLVRLPMSYFEKRHVGDVLSRFGSIEPVRHIVAEGFIAALIDGLMALLTLVMIFLYSAALALIVIAALLICTTIRVVMFRRFRLLNETAILVGARESSTFIESVRAIQALKLHNREIEREGQWLNRFAETVNMDLRIGRTRIGFVAINDTIFGLEYILTLYIAASLALSNQLTVGMIFAFMSYRQQFVEKSLLLVEKALDYNVLKLHLHRIADIALSAPEPGHGRPLVHQRIVRGELTLRKVSFRYSETEPYILEDVNLTVPAGMFITITGPSGGGKTTLLKIMLGLLEPTSGEVLVDGMPLAAFGTRNYREQVAAVMQDDQLLSGSIAENICFLDPLPDQSRMLESACLAGIHDEILAMPMAYNSLIGDMGSSLSGGQKQRVLLARALYRKPLILFLDEGTAHLDVQNERFVNESLRRLNITRISIAHRPEISSGADVVLHIERSHEVGPVRA